MATALFLNGVFEVTLDEIEKVQLANPEKICYLQPHASQKIKLLAESQPTADRPVELYISLTTSLELISYRATIVGWHDKQAIAEDPVLLARLNQHIADFQPSEVNIYPTTEKGTPCTNLIEVSNLRRLPQPFGVPVLIKTSDGKPRGIRSRPGGWSPVFELPNWVGRSAQALKDNVDGELQRGVERSLKDDSEARRHRLELAPRFADAVQVVSRAFRRNPDVIAEVLYRAKGVCENCNQPAPFFRASDGMPFLEVHHRKMLAMGGEDTVANAIALCPNCHRKLHFGKPDLPAEA
jgi:5-methylcytosine-specific restriction protein A